jgi:L-threonylcarbamoyladenylate synthase
MADVVAALEALEPVLLPVDTVYGLCALASSEEAATNLYRLKGRSAEQPTAVLAASVEDLLTAIPELSETILRALLPGAFTLVLPNPARRFPWLAGTNLDAIGIRVPQLPEPTRAAVAAVGAVLATSANDPGGPNPARLDDVPERIRAGCGAELDLGPLPGTPSTVLDLTGPEPRVLREGAASAKDALAALAGQPPKMA